jgi:hypothetical protein
MPFFGNLRKGSPFFGPIGKTSMVGFTLLSRSFTTICVDEVPAPRSRPTTVRQGNGGYNHNTTWYTYSRPWETGLHLK